MYTNNSYPWQTPRYYYPYPGGRWSLSSLFRQGCVWLCRVSHFFAEISYNNKIIYIEGLFTVSKKCPFTRRKYNPLTLIYHIRSKKISLLPIDQATKPPIVIVLVQHLDDITTAYGQFIRPISSVVIQWDNLQDKHSGKRQHEHERQRVHVTELTFAVHTYYLLNRSRICFHIGTWRNVIREGLREKKNIL